MVLPPHGSAPPAPISTNPLAERTDTRPVTAVRQIRTPLARVAMTAPRMTAPLSDSAPPGATVTVPVTRPGGLMQSDWPRATR